MENVTLLDRNTAAALATPVCYYKYDTGYTGNMFCRGIVCILVLEKREA